MRGGVLFKYNDENILKTVELKLNPDKNVLYNCLSCSQHFANLPTNLVVKSSKLRTLSNKKGVPVLNALNEFFNLTKDNKPIHWTEVPVFDLRDRNCPQFDKLYDTLFKTVIPAGYGMMVRLDSIAHEPTTYHIVCLIKTRYKPIQLVIVDAQRGHLIAGKKNIWKYLKDNHYYKIDLYQASTSDGNIFLTKKGFNDFNLDKFRKMLDRKLNKKNPNIRENICNIGCKNWNTREAAAAEFFLAVPQQSKEQAINENSRAQRFHRLRGDRPPPHPKYDPPPLEKSSAKNTFALGPTFGVNYENIWNN